MLGSSQRTVKRSPPGLPSLSPAPPPKRHCVFRNGPLACGGIHRVLVRP